MGEQDKAAEDFKEAVELDPGHAEVYAVQGLLIEAAFHHNREEFQEAIHRATEAIRVDEACGPAYAIRAAAYWYSERHVEAVDDYTQLLEMEEQPSFTTLSGRGQVYAEMGEYQSALDDLDRAIDVESQGVPPAAVAYAQSGRALASAGLDRFEEAERDFASSIHESPLNAWVHYNRGLMQHQLGKTEAAVACFRLALELREPPLPPRKRDRAKGYIRRNQKAERGPQLEPADAKVPLTETSGAAVPQKTGSETKTSSEKLSGEADEHVLDLLKFFPRTWRSAASSRCGPWREATSPWPRSKPRAH